MATKEDIDYLKRYLNELETLIFEYTCDEFEDEDDTYDYDDLKKRIYDMQDFIRSIVERWEI